ncbi:MAG: mog [Dehalococcoidia bacterium]|nr:mog [Dehalococcoidia bacterium]
MYTLGVLTVSDMGAKGQREDTSGQTIKDILVPLGFSIARYEIVPDEREIISARLSEWADGGEVDLLLTTGGTGLGPRDVTPEATLAVIQRPVPGIPEAMRQGGLRHTPLAMLSRAAAGIRGSCLIINLPGSPRAVQEGLEAIIEVIPHALETLKRARVEVHPPH